MTDILRSDGLTLVQEAITAVHPANLIAGRLSLDGEVLHAGTAQIDLEGAREVRVIGAGKAAAAMAAALDDILGSRITGGLVVTKYGHALPCEHIEIMEAGHPLPDANTLKAGARIAEIAREAGEDDLVICLISGGGSALLEMLAEDLDLADLHAFTTAMLACGAGIAEINILRQRLSRLKGGKLARLVLPARCVSLIISDVIGDPLTLIASGPTVPCPQPSIEEIERIIGRYDLAPQLPARVMAVLCRPADAAAVLSEEDARITSVLLGSNRVALKAAADAAERLGYHTLILTSRLRGEAREVARVLVGVIEEIAAGGILERPACLLFGGETTVTMRGAGKGGRNQELALSALQELSEFQAFFYLAAVGTDGTDGPTDAAGAFIDQQLMARIREMDLDAGQFLKDNDAYRFWDLAGGLIKTGPTGTNVMDIGIALLPAG